MATPAHELLKIETARLKTANDAFVRAHYEAAMAEAHKNAASVAQMLALENAFAALNTPEKRANYMAAHPVKAPTQAVKTPTRPIKENSAQQDATVYVIDPKDAPTIKRAYAEFVSKNYKSEPDYTRFRPQEHFFNSIKEFQASTIYNKISANLRDTITKAGFPCGILALPFKNKHDADQFSNAMKAKGLIQEEHLSNSSRMGRSAA